MYNILKFKKKLQYSEYHYVFKLFEDFYPIAYRLTLPLIGVYKICIISNDLEAISKFIKKENEFYSLQVDIYAEQKVIDTIVRYNPSARVSGSESDYDLFMRLISERGILFDKYCIYKLYSSIEHESSYMIEVLDLIVQEYGKRNLITKEMLSQLFVLNDTVYPSQVLRKFLAQDRRRYKSLEMCLSQMDNDVVVGATVKEIKRLIGLKAKYFRTSTTSDERIKLINTENLLLANKVFVTERGGINDAFILYKLYDKGITTLDIKEGKRKYDLL